MATYVYAARDLKGNSRHGFQDASNESEAVRILQSQGLIITRIGPSASAQTLMRRHKMRMHRKPRLEDYLIFVRETATLLEAGIPLLRGIDIIAEQVQSTQLQNALRKVSSDIKAGSTLKEALARDPKTFPKLWIYLVEAGEVSGNLVVVLKQLADNVEATLTLRKKLVSAMVYPMVLVCVAIGAVLVFMLKIIPIFAKVFAQFNAKMPPLTTAVINASEFIQRNMIFMIAGAAAAAWLARRYVRTPSGKRQFDRALIVTPILGPLVQDAIVARITVTLATLIHSGINLLQALEIIANVSGNVVFENAFTKAKLDIQQGKTLSASLEESGLFAPIMIHMILVGEESGKLPDMMHKAAQYYAAKVEVFLTRLSALIEPVILIVVGGIIGVLVVAMFLPIFSLTSIVK